MTSSVIADERRQQRAATALDCLGWRRGDRQVLLAECRRGHTLAALYGTDSGLVVITRPRPRTLDERDLTGREHHRRNRPGREFVDLLHASWADDELPAGCYCGNHTLSRLGLEADLNAGRRLVTVN